MQSRKARRRLHSLARQQIDLGTPETRAKRRLPFWAGWDRDMIDSVEELYRAFQLRAGRSLVFAFDPNRTAANPAAELSPGDAAIYRRLVSWQIAMRRYGLGRFIPMTALVLLNDDPCPNLCAFRGAIELHVRVRRRHFPLDNLAGAA